MADKTPTEEQNVIIESEGNIAVIANPGSGKTFTLSLKIKKILKELPNYKGVIAISYTNKASSELKSRTLDDGTDAKNSFFGTIDSFFYSELILPFLSRLLKLKQAGDIEIISVKDIKDTRPIEYGEITSIGNIKNLKESDLSAIKSSLDKGYFFLELMGIMGAYVYKNCSEARKYIRARYSHIIVDEYQDSGSEQHEIFCSMVNDKIIGIAVGDIDQSIFRWAGKSPKYLQELQDRGDFEAYTITKNHRCHESIVQYSKKILLPSLNVTITTNKRVFYKFIDGTQANIAKWIDSHISSFKEKLNIDENRKIAILVRNNFCAEVIDGSLATLHKFIRGTKLDSCSELWARLFSDLLFFLFDTDYSTVDFLEKWTIYDIKRNDKMELYKKFNFLKRLGHDKLTENISSFELIAKILYPNNESKKSLLILQEILSNPDDIATYIPTYEDEIQILTIHKSKGLEFDLIFHLDMHNYSIPSSNAIKGDRQAMEEDLNLHYVAVTRAKKACFLMTSSKNVVNFKGKIAEWNATPSNFLSMNNLPRLRHNIG